MIHEIMQYCSEKKDTHRNLGLGVLTIVERVQEKT